MGDYKSEDVGDDVNEFTFDNSLPEQALIPNDTNPQALTDSRTG